MGWLWRYTYSTGGCCLSRLAACPDTLRYCCFRSIMSSSGAESCLWVTKDSLAWPNWRGSAGAQGWNFEKAHSILHKVREIVMWGWSENTWSCQGPEHAHIDIIKSVAHLTHNKDVSLCILCYHCRHGLLQQYKQLLEDMVGPREARQLLLDRSRMEKTLTDDRIFSISCELGVLYPSLRAMMNREYFHFDGYAYHILCICCVYTTHIHGYNDSILSKFVWYTI
jgi:hypothetical protein